MKLNALQEISADVSDRLTLLKGGVAKLNDEQTKRLADALAGLSKANAALDAENANIAAARKDYRTVRSQKDAKGVTQVLAELAGRYDAASNRANEVGSHLREVLGILKEAPVQMPVATTAPTPAASAAAEGESAK